MVSVKNKKKTNQKVEKKEAAKTANKVNNENKKEEIKNNNKISLEEYVRQSEQVEHVVINAFYQEGLAAVFEQEKQRLRLPSFTKEELDEKLSKHFY